MYALLLGWPAAGRSGSAVDGGLGVGMCWARAVGLPNESAYLRASRQPVFSQPVARVEPLLLGRVVYLVAFVQRMQW
jgi:hypothetical protein